jgi:hypothetical protein
MMLAEFVLAAALASYPPPKTQGLNPGPPSDSAFVAIPRKVRRPLHLPRLSPGGKCPVSRRAEVHTGYGPALGSGPAYPVGFDEKSTLYYGGPFAPPWSGNKVLWIVDSTYRGPVLVRGHQLDGKWWLGFQRGKRPASELRLNATLDRWKDFPSYTRVRGPGCYAYQIDGLTFSRVVVFRVAPAK